jgi:hypothetical protein
MLEWLLDFDFTDWISWLILAVGAAVAGLVFLAFRFLYKRFIWRYRPATCWTDEDLPWEDLLELMQARQRERAAAGSPPEEDMSPDELLKLLLTRVPARSSRREPELPPEELLFLQSGAAERRAGRRRWGNPTNVDLTSPYLADPLHGLVVNRSAGGLAIFVDKELQSGTTVHVRAAEAPRYIPSVEVEIRYCRKAGKNYIIGCQFHDEIPWNVRVWFG